jgi:carbon starvation protein
MSKTATEAPPRASDPTPDSIRPRTPAAVALWVLIALTGAGALGFIALQRGETINAAWLVTAAVCTYLVAFRFYAKFIAAKVFALDANRLTPAERLNDGKDFVPTNKWVLFGHHFAAIAGPGPLVGPTLAAQFGYLPGALWIIVGVALGGAVQDFVILCASVRRNGKSLGTMAKEEIGSVAGWTALVAILGIMVILMASLGVVVTNALAESPWGVVTVGLTIPIAFIMGIYMRYIRPHAVLEATAIGLVLLAVALFLGRWVNDSPVWHDVFLFSKPQVAIGVAVYGFVAAVLPVWLLLAPRDYLSAFVKIGVVFALAAGIILVLPPLQMPAITQFIDGSGPVLGGQKLFPFAFITIACGSISGFHALVSSGTTPKLLMREPDARFIGYGAMLMESLVGTMALIAACVLSPGVYFAINSPAGVIGTTVESAALAINNWGFVVTPAELSALAVEMGEPSLLSRVGGAPSLAVGMAHIFSNAMSGGGALAIWYHFAIMFEALFILTVVDAGTRVGRFMLQEILKHVWKPLGNTQSYPAVMFSSFLFVFMWAWFLYQGVKDPLGGINSLWPLFGLSNQLLAIVALCVATTIIVKMGKAKYTFVTLMPMAWLLCVTLTAGTQLVFSSNVKLGFFTKVNALQTAIQTNTFPAVGATDAAAAARLITNYRIDAFVALFFMTCVIIIISSSAREWYMVISGQKKAVSSEVPFQARVQPAFGGD